MNEGIGFLGLGAMGMPMARNLVERGFDVHGWDPREEARDAFVSSGGVAARSDTAACACDIVFLSLPHSDLLVKVANDLLLPNAREGQIFVDFTTVVPSKVRSLAKDFKSRGACYLDCPVTGGPGGVEHRVLRLYTGGDPEAFETVRPLLDAISASEWVFYCGESGSGQLVKGVNQLGMGLIQAATMEAVSYGVAAGISPEVLGKAVGGEGGFRAMVRSVCERTSRGVVGQTPIKYDQFDFFLDEASSQEFKLPIVEMLYQLLKDEPKPVRDANQDAPSYWNYLAERFPKV